MNDHVGDAGPVPDVVRRGMVARDDAQMLIKQVTEQLELARERIANLEVALRTNREIAMAIGIVMARQGLTPDAAFAELRAVSQRRHEKVRDVAALVVETGELPG